ncbi:MAG: phosphoribosylaminoimidazolesuccinocarboxamide synthase [Candidatus Latescibacteria bacterium]|nr:phosphoribosylaminoimidazolesuccinocarboxamide synthase [bacterium]MBD3423567.1 phosphoribosylaminoimidazolesuccinocarboxamide synthase [Candidatus Latescibacterota bacterium]
MRKGGTVMQIDIKPDHSGKVRDIYDLGDKLLLVVSDRVSAYDSVLPTRLPGKGIMLNVISSRWFDHFEEIPNHKISIEVEDYPGQFSSFHKELRGRSMLVRKADRVDLECIVRGYITGSGFRSYRESGAVCGIELPEGLVESQKLSEPIFTPSTKADTGHDINISFEKAASLVGTEVIEKMRDISIDIFVRASRYADSRGILIADTKFEFGYIDGELSLIDEVLTPDSSRFWLKDEYTPGQKQKSLDKQFIRDYLDETGWDHNPPGPELPREIVDKTLDRYRMAVKALFEDADLERYGL